MRRIRAGRPISWSRTRSSSTRPAVYKADVAIRDGVISAIGKAGNPDIMDRVSPGMSIGACTEVLAGEGHILRAESALPGNVAMRVFPALSCELKVRPCGNCKYRNA